MDEFHVNPKYFFQNKGSTLPPDLSKYKRGQNASANYLRRNSEGNLSHINTQIGGEFSNNSSEHFQEKNLDKEYEKRKEDNSFHWFKHSNNSSKHSNFHLNIPHSPRPYVRRCFNAIPKPWKARSRSPSPFHLKEHGNKIQSNSFNFKSFSDTFRHLKCSLSDDQGKTFQNKSISFIKSKKNETNTYNVVPAKQENSYVHNNSQYEREKTENFNPTLSIGEGHFVNSEEKYPDFTDKLSVGTEIYSSDVSYHQNSNEQCLLSDKSENQMSELKSSNYANREIEIGRRDESTPDINVFPQMSDCDGEPCPCEMQNLGSVPSHRVVDNSANHGLIEEINFKSVSKNKYINVNENNDSVQNYTTKFKQFRIFDRENTTGADGLQDRKAPFSQSFKNSEQENKLKCVRKKPQIPDKLFRNNYFKENDEKQYVVTILPNKQFHKSRVTVNQILSTLNFARFRLEEITGTLAGSKKDINKYIAFNEEQKQPKLTKFTQLDKLKETTEKLKQSNAERINEICTFPKEINNYTNSSLENFALENIQCNSNSNDIEFDPNKPGLDKSSRFNYLNRSCETFPPMESDKKVHLKARDVPFRTASISQSDLLNQRHGSKKYLNLKIYPSWKDSWKSNTIPRCRAYKKNIEGNSAILNFRSPISLNRMIKAKEQVLGANYGNISSKSNVSLSLNDLLELCEESENKKKLSKGLSMPMHFEKNIIKNSENSTLIKYSLLKNMISSDTKIKADAKCEPESSGLSNFTTEAAIVCEIENKNKSEGNKCQKYVYDNIEADASVDESNFQSTQGQNDLKCDDIANIYKPIYTSCTLLSTDNPKISKEHLLSASRDSGVIYQSTESEPSSYASGMVKRCIANFEDKFKSTNSPSSNRIYKQQSLTDDSFEEKPHSYIKRISEENNFCQGEISDEGILSDDAFSKNLAECSDSSSQESAGNNYRNILHSNQLQGNKITPKIQEKNGNIDKDNLPAGTRRKRVLYRQANLKETIRSCIPKEYFKGYSSQSDNDSRPNSYSEPDDLQYLIVIDENERCTLTKSLSDSHLANIPQESIFVYSSESNIRSFTEDQNKAEVKIYDIPRPNITLDRLRSQSSTDSDERPEVNVSHLKKDKGNYTNNHFQKLLSPPTIASSLDSDNSYLDSTNYDDFSLENSASRTASPSSCIGDGDYCEKRHIRSPHSPRRYSKKPLRGPYGEMLEAEMNKSKPNHPYLNEDAVLFLKENYGRYTIPRQNFSRLSAHAQYTNIKDRESNICGSNSFEHLKTPLSPSSSRSLDDNALRLYCIQKTDGIQKDTQDGKSFYLPNEFGDKKEQVSYPSGSFHQRTSSYPSNLYLDQNINFGTYETKSNENGSIKHGRQLTRTEDRENKPPSRPKKESKSVRTVRNKHDRGGSSRSRMVDGDSSQQTSNPKDKQIRNIGGTKQVNRRNRDTRAHIIGEIYDTEKNYVDNLNFLLTRYMEPLRSSDSTNVIDPSLVDDIFFQVTEIHELHKRFLEELEKLFEEKDSNVSVGKVLLKMIRNPSLIESYISFVNNWKVAQEAAKSAAHAKPAFKHFLGAMAKEHPGKLDLKSLLITPVQRFPHYELILKRLYEHTPSEDSDFELIQEAITEVQRVAASINAIEQEVLQLEQQQFILKEIENSIEGLEGLVQPDRVFLQFDLVSQNSGLGIRKERCLFLFSDILVIAAAKRRNATIKKGASLQLTLLSSLEACKLKLLKSISLDDLEIGRSRDENVKRLVKESECLEQDIQIVSQIYNLVKTLQFFKGSLDDSIHDLDVSLKKQLMDRKGADSQLSELELNITHQEGVETSVFMMNNADKRKKWEEVFNAAKQKLALSADRRPPPEFVMALPIRKTRAGLQFTCASPTLGFNAHNLKDVWVCNSDGYVGQVCIMSLQPEPALASCNGVCGSKILSIASIPTAPPDDSSDDDEDDEGGSDDDRRKKRSESLPPEIGTDEGDLLQPTMWLGTEDGSIHVFNCNDNIRTKKNKISFHPGSSVHCIIHVENRVFASLANGDIVIYERDSQGGWARCQNHVIRLSTAASPVSKMVVAAGKLWCSAGNVIKILNITSHVVEHCFSVGGETGKGVACMVCAGNGVWVSLHLSAVIRVFHATTHDCLSEISIGSSVNKMLAGCDDIIRQHKLACLKVTSLLACKDLLWVGTSAGVIMTLPLPHISLSTRRLQVPLNIVAITHGHTGNVRFLTCVELTPETRPSRLKRYSLKGKDHSHHQSGNAAPPKLLVVSGGDGYEDFRNFGSSELAGRDDSTNHLLLWHV